MPELPEVETIRRDLEERIIGKKIESLEVLAPKMISPKLKTFKKILFGRSLSKIERRGKLLIFSFLFPQTKAYYLLIHLKMTGQLIYIDKRIKIAGGHSSADLIKSKKRGKKESEYSKVVDEVPNKHTRIIFRFMGGGVLYFNDLRKFAYLKIVDSKELNSILLSNYGPEPLSPDFSLTFLESLVKKRRTSIKALLLNQRAIAGLGNIYVDESLFLAGIRPQRLANSLIKMEVSKLRRAINHLIKKAIKERGTTFSTYIDSRGKQGNFSRFLKVYGRGGKKCLNCGHLIVKTKLAGRGTHYCPHCQR